MASRAQQKEEARQRRLAEERARAERTRRQRRLQMVLGAIVAAVAVAVVAIAVNSGGGGNGASSAARPTSPAAKANAAAVTRLLAGIPQSGNRLGSGSAKVTVTEFGDLECPVCAAFASSAENTLITNDVRSGKVDLIYRAFCTATCNGPNRDRFTAQQAAALAAGKQGYGWHYIELFYREQGQEGTSYVTDAYLNGLARQIPGLNYAKWLRDRSSSELAAQVAGDQQQAQIKGYNGTPTVVVQGPKGTAPPITNDYTYPAIKSAIKSVS